jgi:ABC-2 type transport system permease protein
MTNILTIARKEWKLYFVSPIAYALLAIFALITGWMSLNAIAIFMARTGRGGPADLNGFVIEPILMNAGVISLFLVPMITMRLFAEENRSGTIELLVTSPVRDIEIILGKLLGALAMYLSMLAVLFVSLSFCFFFGNPDWRPVVTGYAGVALQAAALLSLGMFISSTTKNQIVAGAITFGLGLLLWTFDWATSFETSTWARVLAYLSLTSHLNSFARGVIDLKDFVYYLSVIAAGIFLTARSLESIRWRG